MSGQRKKLLVDIGNSRIKYAWAPDPGQQIKAAVCSMQALLSIVPDADQVLVSNVSKREYSEAIEQACIAEKCEFFEAQTQAQTFGLVNAYERFETMGVDRWLAVLATSTMTELPYAVLDIGTAATCDFVNGNRHLGGWIAPGFEMMRNALFSNTQKVFGDDHYPANLVVGRSTPECVNMGCLSAVQGLYLNARRILEADFSEFRIFVTGGAKDLLNELADDNTLVVSELVFRGLMRFVQNDSEVC